MSILRIYLLVLYVVVVQKSHTQVTTVTPSTYSVTDRYFKPPRLDLSYEIYFQQYINQIFSSMTYELLKDCVIKFRHITKYAEMYHGTINYEIGLYATEIKVVFNDMIRNYRFHSNKTRLNMFKDNPSYTRLTSLIYNPYEELTGFKTIATEEMYAGFFKMLSLYNQILFLRRRFYQTIEHYEFLRRNASIHRKSTMTLPIVRRNLKNDVLAPYYDSNENSGEYELDYFGHRIFKSTKAKRFTRRTTKDPKKYVPLYEGKKRYRNMRLPADLQKYKTLGDWNSFLNELMSNKEKYSKKAKKDRVGLKKPGLRQQGINRGGKINKPMTEKEYKRELHWDMLKKSVGNFSPILEGIDIDLIGLFKK